MNQTTKPAACPDSVRVELHSDFARASHPRRLRFPQKRKSDSGRKTQGFGRVGTSAKKVGIRARLLAPLGVLCAHNALSGLTQRRKRQMSNQKKTALYCRLSQDEA